MPYRHDGPGGWDKLWMGPVKVTGCTEGRLFPSKDFVITCWCGVGRDLAVEASPEDAVMAVTAPGWVSVRVTTSDSARVLRCGSCLVEP